MQRLIMALIAALTLAGCAGGDARDVRKEYTGESAPAATVVQRLASDEAYARARTAIRPPRENVAAYLLVTRQAKWGAPPETEAIEAYARSAIDKLMQGVPIDIPPPTVQVAECDDLPNTLRIGVIQLCRGSVLRAPDDAAFMFLMAHELAHYALDHAGNLERRKAAAAPLHDLAALATVATWGASGVFAAMIPALAGETAIGAGQGAVVGGVSRALEDEADLLGIDLLVAAGYGPEPSLDMLARGPEAHGRFSLADAQRTLQRTRRSRNALSTVGNWIGGQIGDRRPAESRERRIDLVRAYVTRFHVESLGRTKAPSPLRAPALQQAGLWRQAMSRARDALASGGDVSLALDRAGGVWRTNPHFRHEVQRALRDEFSASQADYAARSPTCAEEAAILKAEEARPPFNKYRSLLYHCVARAEHAAALPYYAQALEVSTRAQVHLAYGPSSELAVLAFLSRDRRTQSRAERLCQAAVAADGLRSRRSERRIRETAAYRCNARRRARGKADVEGGMQAAYWSAFRYLVLDPLGH